MLTPASLGHTFITFPFFFFLHHQFWLVLCNSPSLSDLFIGFFSKKQAFFKGMRQGKEGRARTHLNNIILGLITDFTPTHSYCPSAPIHLLLTSKSFLDASSPAAKDSCGQNPLCHQQPTWGKLVARGWATPRPFCLLHPAALGKAPV